MRLWSQAAGYSAPPVSSLILPAPTSQDKRTECTPAAEEVGNKTGAAFMLPLWFPAHSTEQSNVIGQMTKQSRALRPRQLQLQEPGLLLSIYFFPADLQTSGLKRFFGERKAPTHGSPPRPQPPHLTLLYTQWKNQPGTLFCPQKRCKSNLCVDDTYPHGQEDTCRT